MNKVTVRRCKEC